MMKRQTLCILLLIFTICTALNASIIPVKPYKKAGHTILDFRKGMTMSCFDDGVADNQKGGWTDEGLNDFNCFPKLTFGPKKYRGYFFDFVDPTANKGKNLVMTGTEKCWPKLPKTVTFSNIDTKGKYLFIMHSEGRCQKGKLGGNLTITYTDDTKASLPLRMGKELANWYQGRWWNNYEEAHPDAPEVLKKSKCNPDVYKKLGGKNFKDTVLKHATAVRWPVTQGLNSISKNWKIPIVFWALKWQNPHPGKTIKSITLNSKGICLIAIAAITITDTDFSLDRQTLGKMGPPPAAPLDFFEKIASKNEAANLALLLKKEWTKGLRNIQIRSDKIVTAHVDHIARLGKLKAPNCYLITSKDDPDFKAGIKPVSVDRFSKGARYRALKGDQFKVYSDHWLHLHLPKKLKWGKHYKLTLINGLIPESKKLKTSMIFSLDKTPNPSFKLNQVGYSNKSHKKLIYLSSYLGDGNPVDLSTCKTLDICNTTTGKVVFSSKLKKVSDCDSHGKDKLYVADISAFKTPGQFYAKIPRLGRSYAFFNGDEAAKKVYELTHRGIFFQRSGFEFKQPYAEKWERPMAHNKIYVTTKNLVHPTHKVDPQTKKSGEYYVPHGAKKIHGGHYDAGDYDLRPMHINIPELLMSLYEALPENFYDGQVNIPENRNGIPDILDEAAWNLLSLEYIQDYAAEIRDLNGGVAPGMETYKHPGKGEGCGNDKLPYYMRKVTPMASFCAAAEFAHAARLFKPFNKKRSAKYLKRAKKAYHYAMKHLNDPQPKLPSGKPDQGEGWNEKSLTSAKCWAAAQLYATTGNKIYLKTFIDNYKNMSGHPAGSISYWAMMCPILTTKYHVPKKLRNSLKNKLLHAADRGIAFIEQNAENGYCAPLRKGGGWGVTSCVARNIEAVTRAYLLTKKQKYLDAIATSVDFTLGMNPSEMSWMTGAGSVYPMDPCNLNSLDDGVEEPQPGILVYGPTNYWKDTKVVFYPDKSKMGFYRRYSDSWGMIGQCEYTVWETQAPFLFAVGTLLSPNNNKK